jgi:uncharacterized protein YegL
MTEVHNEIMGGVSRSKINLFYLLDTSGSMSGERINQLNIAMVEALSIAEEVANEKEWDLAIRVIEFNNVAKWIIGDPMSGQRHIEWKPLTAQGGTDTAGAIKLVKEAMNSTFLGSRALTPVVILITDGESSKPAETIEAITELKNAIGSSSNTSEDKIMRIAIGVKDAKQIELENFASLGKIFQNGVEQNNVPLVFNLNNVDDLKETLKMVTEKSIVPPKEGGNRFGDWIV